MLAGLIVGPLRTSTLVEYLYTLPFLNLLENMNTYVNFYAMSCELLHVSMRRVLQVC